MDIIVLAGGLSSERDVSLTSGASITKSLREQGHRAFLLDVYFGLPDAPDNLEDVFDLPDWGLDIVKGISSTMPDQAELDALKKSRPDQSDCYLGPNVIDLCRIADMVFMGLHGSVGENGKLQATFDILGIKYTGPGSLGCALSMDKRVAKEIFRMSDVPTPLGTYLTAETKNTPLSELGYDLPLVVKANSSGSSIGVYIVETEEEYREAVDSLFALEDKEDVIVEPYIHGREFACGILGGKALPLVEIIPKNGVFDYENKYQAGGSEELCPPVSIGEDLQKEIQRAGEKAFEALRMDVYGRADFIVDENDGEFYCMEVNALPGMTSASLLPKAAKTAGLDYNDLCAQILAESIKARYE